jgi:hypothetical protein
MVNYQTSVKLKKRKTEFKLGFVLTITLSQLISAFSFRSPRFVLPLAAFPPSSPPLPPQGRDVISTGLAAVAALSP